jgi:hypothetical protein
MNRPRVHIDRGPLRAGKPAPTKVRGSDADDVCCPPGGR